MKNFFTICLLSATLTSHTVLADNTEDKLNLAGIYKCTGFDNYEGSFDGTITLTLDEKASDFEHNFGSYQFTLNATINGKEIGNYDGYAAAHGSNLAIYFENINHTDPVALTDRGVGIAQVSHKQDVVGKFTTTINKFYYLPKYKRDATDGKGKGGMGGFGTESCVKIDK